MILLTNIACLLFLKPSLAANILAVIPIPSYSHQITYRPLFKELAKRGHNLTLLTTDPIRENITNIRQIDWHDAYGFAVKYNISEVTSSGKSMLNLIQKNINYIQDVVEYELCHPEVQQIFKRGEKFDLVISEYLLPGTLAFGYKLNCPYIGVVSLDAHIHSHAVMGNAIHPIVNPDFNLPFSTNLSLKERIYSVLYFVAFKLFIYFARFKQNEVLRKCFGEDIPNIVEIERNISMLFVNANPIFNNVRNMGPATINIGGGIHITEPKPLPTGLETLLDNATEGAIYFSLGSNVKSKHINNNTKRIILETFAELPYTILWKFEDDIIEKPENLHIAKWYPQVDILRHPNIKLFITQGGLQSMEEAIFSHVPMIGIPFYGDQFNNVNKMVLKGFGLSLDHTNIIKNTFYIAIHEVINNPTYKKNLVKLANLVLDQPMTGLEKAVWWTEYVIRHKGAKNLRNPVLDVPIYQYLFLDIFLFFSLITFTLIIITYLIGKFIIKLYTKFIFSYRKQKLT